MRRILVAALMLALAAPIFAQEIEPMVLDLDKEARGAYLRGDTTFFENHTTDDFMAISPRGGVRTRSEAIAEIKSGALKFASLQYDDVGARRYGDDTIILSGRATVTGTLNDKDMAGQYRVTRVWVKMEKNKGEWRLASLQYTLVMP